MNDSDYNYDAEYDLACVPGDPVRTDQSIDPYKYINVSASVIPSDKPVAEIAIKVSFYVIPFLIDIIGNSIVIIIITVNKRMRTTTNMLILNLAVSDLLVGCFCMWVHVGNSITTEYPFDEYVCKVNTFMQVSVVTSSVLTLTAISVERFFAICYPLMSRMSPKFTAIVILVNWIISFTMGSPQLVVRKRYEYIFRDRHQIWCEETWPRVYINKYCDITEGNGRKVYYTIAVVVMYIIPIVIMVCAYIMIAYKMVTRRQPGTGLTSISSHQERAKKKVIRMLVAVMTAFIVCWTPFQGLTLWNLYKEKGIKTPESINEFKYAATFIAFSCSAINPILYGGFNENFRKGFIAAFECILLKKRNAVDPTDGGSRANQGSNTTAAGGSNTRPE